MIEILQGIADFVGSLGGYVVSFFTGLVSLFRYVGMAISTAGLAIVYLPVELQVMAFAFVGAAVLFLIVGR